MKSFYVHLVMLLTVMWLGSPMIQSAPESTGPVVMAGPIVLVAVVLVAVVLVARVWAVVPCTRISGVGSRARQHREVLTESVAPRHPNTAGRPRPRAPGLTAAIP